MMLVDIGNSSLKWRVDTPDGFSDSGHFTHCREDFSCLADAAWGHLPDPGRVVAASVAGQGKEAAIGAWLQEHWQITPEFIRARAAAGGVINGYAAPETLGADRWAALIAARHAYAGDVCVIDCGTAITLDLLDAAGRHQGGLIVPGIGMMKQALFYGTAGVRPVSGEPGSDAALPSSMVLGRGTREAVDNGVQYMVRAMLEHAIADIHATSGAGTAIVLTGGDVIHLLPLAGPHTYHEPDLVLNGLAILARELECVT